jgi:hypothetical protein
LHCLYVLNTCRLLTNVVAAVSPILNMGKAKDVKHFMGSCIVKHLSEGYNKGVTKKCRLSWLTNSALVRVYDVGDGGVAGSQPMSTAVHMEPK